jgi:hypothetical protein
MTDIIPLAQAAARLGVLEQMLADYARHGLLEYVRDHTRKRSPISGIYASSLEAFAADRDRRLADRKRAASERLKMARTQPRKRGPGYCPRCSQRVSTPGLCQDCQAEAAGVPYYVDREDVCACHRGAFLAGMR